MDIRCNILVLVCVAHMVASDMSQFEQSIQHLVNSVLHVRDMQNVLDNQVTVTSETVNGASLISQLTSTLTTKINERFQLVRLLQQVVAVTYKDFFPMPGDNTCCHYSSHFGTMDERFKASVNMEEMCIRKSMLADSDSKYATRNLLQQFISNRQAVPDVKYQYLGTNQGVLFSYPATPTDDCLLYDPRFRPWYVGTAMPITKDIVLLIDISGSMNTHEDRGRQEYDEYHTRLYIAKEAAIKVIVTLNPNDRVGVVAFNAYGHTYQRAGVDCYKDTLAVANPSNKRLLLDFIISLQPGGESYYSRGLERAFSFFTNESAAATRSAILLFSDASPTESMAGVVSLITEKESLLNNAVTIMPCGIGRISAEAQQILGILAMTAQSRPMPPVIVTEIAELKYALVPYYYFFWDVGLNTPVLASPYYDAFGLGLITTVSLPVYHTLGFIGVVGIDISISDLVEDISYFEQDTKTYAFIGTTNAMALSHPMLAIPTNVKDDPVRVKLELLEKYTNIVDIMASMMGGGEGTLTTPTTVVQARGNGKTDGIAEVAYNANYYWAQIKDNMTDANILCVAIKIATDYAQTRGALISPLTAATNTRAPTTFTYHVHRLMPTGREVCAHFKCKAIVGDSVVKFSPQAFMNPFIYTDTAENKDTVSQFNNIILRTQTNDVFKDGVVDTVEITSKIHDFWFDATENHAVWRYVAFSNGVLRITPGTELQKDYNPTERNWYKRALAFPGKYVISAPYLDAFGAGYVITFNHVLFRGVPGAASHASTEATEGVMGIDVTVNYFYYIFMDKFPECTQAENKCFVVDSGGYIVLHPDFVEMPGNENPLNGSHHITIKEKGVANYLIRNSQMVQKSCHDPNSLIEHIFYEIDLDTVTSVSNAVENPNFEMQLIPGTNAYLVTRQADSMSPQCPCLDPVDDSVHCAFTITDCMCPCAQHHLTTNFQPCSNNYNFNNINDFKVCPPEGAKIVVDTSPNIVPTTTPQCYPVTCPDYGNSSLCYQYPQCNWCMHDTVGDPLGADESLCQSYSHCYFGQISYRSPYDVFHNRVTPASEGMSLEFVAVTTVSVCGGILLVVVLAFVIKLQTRQHPTSLPPGKDEAADKPSNVSKVVFHKSSRRTTKTSTATGV